MNAPTPLERMAMMRAKSEESDQLRQDYARFTRLAAELLGWNPADLAEYRDQIAVLMKGSDEEVLALFPEGLYASAEEARQGAATYWRSVVELHTPRLSKYAQRVAA